MNSDKILSVITSAGFIVAMWKFKITRLTLISLCCTQSTGSGCGHGKNTLGNVLLMNGDVFEKCTIIQKYKLCVLDKIADIFSDLYLF